MKVPGAEIIAVGCFGDFVFVVFGEVWPALYYGGGNRDGCRGALAAAEGSVPSNGIGPTPFKVEWGALVVGLAGIGIFASPVHVDPGDPEVFIFGVFFEAQIDL